jgi:hypothetical protein
MYRFVLCILFFAQCAEISFAARRVTIEQLNQVVTSAQGKRDGKIAERLLTLELSERLSAAKFAAMQSALPGPESRQALTIIAGMAEFQDPPSTELPNQPAPTLEEQRDIAARAIDHINATIHRLPTLFVTRSADHFEDTPADLQTTGTESKSGIFSPSQSLHLTGHLTENITYRYGDVFILSGINERSDSSNESAGLGSTGEFGQILSTIFSDLSKGKLEWGRWEQTESKTVAVFRFSVPREASHHQLLFCCSDGEVIEKFTAYHGVIAIDPADGAILRLSLVTDPPKNDPITKANLMVEYGTVELGGQKFTCPTRSVAVSIARMQPNHQRALPAIGSSVSRGNVVLVDRDNSAAMPLQIMLNTVVYDHYSLTRPN